jgi:hypothetical protein
MLSSGMITPPFFIFPENFTHSLSAQPASLRCLPFGSKLFQGIATMTYTRSHTRPSQKDLGCVVYPLNNKSLARTMPRKYGILKNDTFYAAPYELEVSQPCGLILKKFSPCFYCHISLLLYCTSKLEPEILHCRRTRFRVNISLSSIQIRHAEILKWKRGPYDPEDTFAFSKLYIYWLFFSKLTGVFH